MLTLPTLEDFAYEQFDDEAKYELGVVFYRLAEMLTAKFKFNVDDTQIVGMALKIILIARDMLFTVINEVDPSEIL